MNKLPPRDKHNKTENAFLPNSLKGAVRAEAGFPISSKSGHGSFTNNQGLPSIKGAHLYTDDSVSNKYYEDMSQKSMSQNSLAISQRRGEKIVSEHRK